MPGGEVRVILKNRPKLEGVDVFGHWDESKREITVDPTSPPGQQWRTYYHEWAHVALADSGADELFQDQIVELLCDAVATARMRERFG
jgi:hypothetical protein